MKRLLLSLGLCLAIVGGAAAQTTNAAAEKSDAVLKKVHQVDLLIQILPLSLKKEQFGPILLGLEKARSKQKQIVEMEAKDLEKLDTKLTDAVNKGLDKGEYPPKDLQVEAVKLLRALGIRRQFAVNEITDEFYMATVATFDEGQKKVMANSLDIASLDPTAKREKDEDKIKFFMRRILLDPDAYDVLLRLQKIAS